MKIVLIGMLISGSFSALATNLKCNISSIKEAQLCMNKVAAKHVEYNLPNIGSASSQKSLLKKVLKATGYANSNAYKVMEKTIDNSDFVGVMLEKGDEWYLYYYALKKGQSTSPEYLTDMNLVDLEYNLTSKISLADLILGDVHKKFDSEDRKWIKEYLDR